MTRGNVRPHFGHRSYTSLGSPARARSAVAGYTWTLSGRWQCGQFTSTMTVGTRSPRIGSEGEITPRPSDGVHQEHMDGHDPLAVRRLQRLVLHPADPLRAGGRANRLPDPRDRSAPDDELCVVVETARIGVNELDG